MKKLDQKMYDHAVGKLKEIVGIANFAWVEFQTLFPNQHVTDYIGLLGRAGRYSDENKEILRVIYAKEFGPAGISPEAVIRNKLIEFPSFDKLLGYFSEIKAIGAMRESFMKSGLAFTPLIQLFSMDRNQFQLDDDTLAVIENHFSYRETNPENQPLIDKFFQIINELNQKGAFGNNPTSEHVARLIENSVRLQGGKFVPSDKVSSTLMSSILGTKSVQYQYGQFNDLFTI